MTANFSERTRAIVAEALPLMEQHRAPLEEALERYVADRGPYDPSAARSKLKTGAILDMLLGYARQLGEAGAPVGIVDTARHHQELALGGEHYSCFGDALKPIMQDVLGSRATPPVLAAWGDTYWAIVRMFLRQETRLAA